MWTLTGSSSSFDHRRSGLVCHTLIPDLLRVVYLAPFLCVAEALQGYKSNWIIFCLVWYVHFHRISPVNKGKSFLIWWKNIQMKNWFDLGRLGYNSQFCPNWPNVQIHFDSSEFRTGWIMSQLLTTFFDRPKFSPTFLFDTPKFVRVACCASDVLLFHWNLKLEDSSKPPAYLWHTWFFSEFSCRILTNSNIK